MWLLKLLGTIWSLPVTLMGLLLAIVTGCKHDSTTSSALIFEASDWLTKIFFDKFNVWAFTWGAIIIFRKGRPMTAAVLRHELVHTFQCQIFGPLIILMYPLGSLVALCMRLHPYFDNFLEIWARESADQKPSI